MELIRRAQSHRDRTAVVTPEAAGGFSYGDLLDTSARLAEGLRRRLGVDDLAEARIAFMVPPGFDYPALQWAIWRAGGIAVPLCLVHPPPELAHVLDDADPRLVVATQEFEERLGSLVSSPHRQLVPLRELLATPGTETAAPLPEIEPERRAMIVYTSGTTGRPKGAVTTHANILAQIDTLRSAWGWNPQDRILHVLPLHHVHGIINVLGCALASGAVWEALPRFDADAVWDRIGAGGITLFMAVPTIYARLIRAWEERPEAERAALSRAASRLRLMVSGSAALPVQALERWREITGHTLLERYGMTEIGMALSNPLEGERRPGCVGRPLPTVEVRRLDDADGDLPEEGDESARPGQLLIRGPSVFREYWQRPDATAEAFHDGWFRTGDMAVVEDGAYRLLGRSSVDILKSGGYKISALEIEAVLRDHPAIRDCAVVGVPDPEWGERVAVALVLDGETALPLEELRTWGKERLAPYKVPSLLRCLEDLPRNALGKVVKPRVLELFTASS